MSERAEWQRFYDDLAALDVPTRFQEDVDRLREVVRTRISNIDVNMRTTARLQELRKAAVRGFGPPGDANRR